MSFDPVSNPLDVLVVGAGVLGLCTALELADRGHDVAVLDPGGSNASSVAAGMVAPALESAAEDVSLERAGLLLRAARLWPAFSSRFGITLIKACSEWRGEGADDIAARLERLGFAIQRQGQGVQALDDFRIDAGVALDVMAAALPHPLIKGQAHSLTASSGLWAVGHGCGLTYARRIVLATGASPAVPGVPASLAGLIDAIVPIRGQIGSREAFLSPGVIRGRGVYIASGPETCLIGATMEEGRRDLLPDDASGRSLAQALSRLLQRPVDGGEIQWRVGIRGATRDGLPLAGATEVAGLFVALAPRRNGWLMGPLVGRSVSDAIEGRPPQRDATALDPMRDHQLSRATGSGVAAKPT